MSKDTKAIKVVNKKPLLKKRAVAQPPPPKAEITPPGYPLFERIQIQTIRMCRNTAARILKLLLNGDIPPDRCREGRLYLELAVQLNREIQLRDRLDKICQVLQIQPEPQDLEDQDLDLAAAGVTDDGSE